MKKKDIYDYLEDFGITIDKISDDKVEELLKNGYEKVPEGMFENIDMMIQYFPSHMVETMARKDVVKKSQKMLEGAYRVSIKKGTHLAKSKATKGAVRGALLADSNNQLAGQAEFFRINETLALGKAPQVALCVFDAVSVVIGQYYLAEINHRLNKIEAKTDSILSYLENTTRGDLWASDQILDEIIKYGKDAVYNDIQRVSYYQMILAAKRDTLAKMKLFDLQINSLKLELTPNSKAEDIQKLAGKVAEYYPQYWFTIYLYAKCVLCEIFLGQIDDVRILGNMRDEIQDYIKRYKIAFENDRKKLTNVIDNAKAYNMIKFPTIGLMGSSPEGIIISAIYNAIAATENKMADRKSVLKKETITRFNQEMDDFGNVIALEEATKAIDHQIKRVVGDIDIIKSGKDFYIKYSGDDLPTASIEK